MKEMFEFEHTKIRKRKLTDDDPDQAMWLFETPQRRLEALEFIRQNHNGINYATERIQEVHRIIRRK